MKLEEINRDKRGTISIVTGLENIPEITIFCTNKGYARGGCIHKISNEYSSVLYGDVDYFINDDDKILKTGESIMIPKNSPHYLVSLTDSIVIEWGATPEEKKDKHAETRKIVEVINDNGRHSTI